MIYKSDFLAKKKEAAAGGRGEVLYKKSGNDPDRKKQAYPAKTPGHDESKMCWDLQSAVLVNLMINMKGFQFGAVDGVVFHSIRYFCFHCMIS